MSTTIDQRVVEMQFDNKQFESNVQTSLSTLAKLKQSLNLEGATKGLENIGSAVKNVGMSGLSGAVETVHSKFSAMEVMAVTALANITNSAVNAGKKIVSSLTVDPVKLGFQEYETQINAIQTILANTSHAGTDLEDVNNVLDDLNQYADRTIYNFTQMTRNIGTFTAAGLGLEESAMAIKGIANLAAVSGSTSQQASTAMYQLSQALANGKVNLQDWNSVVNAGMGGKVFQDALVRTAAVMKGVTEETFRAQNVTGSFRESISSKDGSGWLTADILSKTLQQFTGDMTDAELAAMGFTEEQIKNIQTMAVTANDAATKVKTVTQLFDTLKEAAQSGWTQSWEIIVGDFEESKALLTEVSDTIGEMINNMSASRNALLEEALGKKDAVTYISDYTGMKAEGIKELQAIGKELGYTSDKYQELVNQISEGDKVVADTVTNLLKMAETETDVISYISDYTGMNEEGIKDLQTVGKELGYNSEQYKKLVKEISEGDENVANTITHLLQMSDEISKLSGREMLVNSLRNAFEGVMSVIKPVKEAFREIFPAMTAEQLYNITAAIQNFTAKLKLNSVQSANLKTTFKGLFAVLDIVKEALTAVWKNISPLLGGMGGLLDTVLLTTASWGEWLLNLRDTIKETDFFNEILSNFIEKIKTIAETIKSKLTSAFEIFKNFVVYIKENFKLPGLELLHSLLERIHERMTQVGKAAGEMHVGVSGSMKALGRAIEGSKFFKLLQTVLECVKVIGSELASALGSVINKLTDKLSNTNFDSFLDVITSLSLGGVAVALSKFLKSVTEPLEGLQGVLDGVTGILDGVRGCFEAYQTQLKAGTLIKIATAIGILTASIVALALIDSGSLMVAIGAITTLFTELMASMAIFNVIAGSSSNMTKACTTMISMSAAVLILSGAMTNLAGLAWGDIAKGLVGIAGLTATVIAAAKLMATGDDKKAIKGATNMVVFAAAIKVLASACEDLSGLSVAELTKGLVGVGVLIAEVTLFMNTAKFGGNTMSTATGIVVLSAAIKVLASACKDFGSFSVEELVKGLASVGVLLLEMAAFTRLIGDTKGIISTGVAMVAIAASMKIFASAVGDFGGMDLATLGKGLLAMGIALGEVAIAMTFMPDNMLSIGAGLVVVGAALVIVADALGNMSEMSTAGLMQSLMGMGIALGEIAIGLYAMNGTLAGSAALLVAVAALAVLTPVLSVLGAMPVENIVKGLLTIAGAFAVIGVAGVVLTPVVAVIAALSGALLLVSAAVLGAGVGLLAAGAGLSAIAVGFTALATAVAGGAAAIVSGLGVIITAMAGLIPAVVTKIAEGIVAFAVAITEGLPAICEAVTKILTAVIKTVVEVVPLLVDAIFLLITNVLSTLAKYAPDIIQSVFSILISSLQIIAENLPLVVQAAIDVVLKFIEGIAKKIPDVIQAGFDLLISFINGITEAITVNTPLLVQAMTDLFWALVDAALAVLTGNLNLFKEAGKRIMDNGLIKAITNKVKAFGDSVKEVVDNGVQAIKDKVSDWKNAGRDLIDGFVGGIMDKAHDAIEAAKGVVSSALEGAKRLLGINSPSKEFEKVGRWSDEGLINGFISYAGKVASAAEDVGSGALDAMSEALAGISDVINTDIDTQPTIRPVLDLSNVESGTSRLNALFSRSQAVSISASMNGTNDDDNQNGINSSPRGNVYQFTQNNYSPKALSRVDIYRQTKNQFSAMERAVEA